VSDGAFAFIALELFAAAMVFFVFPAVSAAVFTGFAVVAGRQAGLNISDRAVWKVAVACALIAPLPELLTINFWPPGASAAWHVFTWVTLLPGAFLGAFVAAPAARRFTPAAEETPDAGDPVGMP